MIPQARAAITYAGPTRDDIPVVNGVEDVYSDVVPMPLALQPSATGSLMILSRDISHTLISTRSCMAFHNMSRPYRS